MENPFPIIHQREQIVNKTLPTPNELVIPTRLDHLRKHWAGGGSRKNGSYFIPNDAFRTLDDLIRMVKTNIYPLIEADANVTLGQKHMFLIDFGFPIGRSGIVLIEPDENVFTKLLNKGTEDEICTKVVYRFELPETTFLTVYIHPVYETDENGIITVKMQLASAFPGEPVNKPITVERTRKFKSLEAELNALKKSSRNKTPEVNVKIRYGEEFIKSYEQDLEFWNHHARVEIQRPSKSC